MCGEKCKCTDCLNRPGSQALIDKRRKMKDQKGADLAMRVSDEEWRRQSVNSARKSIPPGAQHGHDQSSSHHRRPLPSPANRMPPQSHMMHPGPYSGPHGGPPPHHGNRPYPHHPHFMGHPPPHMMRGHPGPPMGYSPMGVPMTPGGFAGPPPPHHHRMPPSDGMPRAIYHPPQQNRPTPMRKQPPKDPRLSQKQPVVAKVTETPSIVTSKPPAGVRRTSDQATSHESHKVGESESEERLFGEKLPPQSKITALKILSFLGSDDMCRVGRVCKQWSKLAVDKELLKFLDNYTEV
jgi:hypothetical protein